MGRQHLSIARVLAWSLAYFVLAYYAQMFAGGADGIVPVWPAIGIALFLVLRHGPAGLLPVAIGGAATVANAYAEPLRLAAELLLVGATIVGALAARHACRLAGGAADMFGRTRDMVVFLIAGCLVISAVAALIGVLVLYLTGAFPGTERLVDLPPRFMTWFISDLAGTVLVTPLLMAWNGREEFGRPSLVSLACWLALIVAAITAWLVDFTPDVENAAMLLLFGPTLAAAALTTKPRAFTAIVLSGAFIAVTVVVDNIYEAQQGLRRETVALLLVQLYLVSIVETHLVLYAAITESRRSIAERVNLSKHFSPNMVDLIARLGRPFEKPHRQPATVLFCDLRNFTRLSEAEGPEATIALLRDFHATMTDIVFRHEGTLDRYLGDGLMAVFGMPEPSPDDALRAIACAREMQEALAGINERRRARGEAPLDMGIGLHTGEVMLGDIGSETTRSVTVIGDTVNVASRLQSLSKEIDAAIVLSTETRAAALKACDGDAGPLSGLVHVGIMTLRGHSRPTDTWSLPRLRPAVPAA